MDASLDFAESELVARTGVLKGFGSTAVDAARVLDELHPRLGYRGGSIDSDSASILFQRDPWIAFSRTGRRTIHSVIVDALAGDIVRIRDPWGISGPGSGAGTRATIRLSDFLEHWHWAINNVIYPCRRK